MKNPKIVVTDNRENYYWKKYFRSLVNRKSVFGTIDNQETVSIKINNYE